MSLFAHEMVPRVGERWAGVDEAGRGPLAGAVFAAAVILPEKYDLPKLTDSKKLSAMQREKLATAIKAQAVAWFVASSSVAEIDSLNILQATLLAMQRAVNALSVTPTMVWIDGNRAPQLAYPSQTLIQGDALMPAISAASILAKTARDAELIALDRLYPQYGFAKHKGYGTAAHVAALQAHGASPVHRQSFRPVREAPPR